MDDATLIRRLAGLRPPEPDLARERAAAAVPLRVRAMRPDGRRGSARLSPRLAAAFATLLVALTALTLFTPPGQAFTSWVGDRLGFGQPGEHPSLRQLRHKWTRGTSAEGQPAHVLAVGPAPHGGRYEFITYWPRQPKGKSQGRWLLGKPCFELDLTQERSSLGSGCGVLPEGPYMTMGLGGNSFPGDQLLALHGRVSPDVASVEARLNGASVPVEVVPIPARFVRRFRLGQPFSFFVAFLVGKLHGGKLVATARDSSGAMLARRSFDCFSTPEPPPRPRIVTKWRTGNPAGRHSANTARETSARCAAMIELMGA